MKDADETRTTLELEEDSQDKMENLEKKQRDNTTTIENLQKDAKKEKFVKNEILKIIDNSNHIDLDMMIQQKLTILEKTDPDVNIRDTISLLLNKGQHRVSVTIGEKNPDEEPAIIKPKLKLTIGIGDVVKGYKQKYAGDNIKGSSTQKTENKETELINGKKDDLNQRENFEIQAFYSGDQAKINEIEDQVRIEEDEYRKLTWQYCLVFPNPDYKEKIKYINPDDTIELYDKCFLPDNRGENQKHQKLLENQTYYNVLEFLQIDKNNMYFKNGGKSLSKSRGGKWQQYDTNARDIETLIRNITLYKLTKVLNFKALSLLSEVGDLVYVLLSVDDESLSIEAEKINYPLQFETGSTDLVGLEPTDSSLNPLRYCNLNKPEYIKHIELELREFFQILYENDEDALLNQQTGEVKEILDTTWEAYKEFLNFLLIEKNETMKVIRKHRELKGFIVKRVYQKALSDTTKKTGIKLLNLWDYFQLRNVGGFYKYFAPDFENPNDIDKNNSFWKKYISINQKSQLVGSIFKNVDKLKLIYSKLSSQFHLEAMVENKVLINYFPLHGDSYFEESPEAMNEKIKDIIRDHLGADAHFAEEEKKNDVMSRFLKKGEEDREEQEKLYAKQVITSILVKKFSRIDNNIQELAAKLNKNYLFMLFGELPVTKVKAYFGEKVSMYYEFLSLYIKFLFVLAIYGIIVFAIEWSESVESQNIEYYVELGFTKDYAVTIFSIIYSIAIIIWSSLFIEYWKKKEKTISTMWGQLDFEETEEIMPQFRGDKRRSPINDNLNDLYSSKTLRNLKVTFGLIITLLILSAIVVMDIFLLQWKIDMVSDEMGWNDNVILSQIPSFLIVVHIFLFNYIFNWIIKRVSLYENPKHFTEYEESLASKNFYASLFIIAFFIKTNYFFHGCSKSTVVEFVSYNNYCDNDLSIQMIVIIMTKFISNLLHLVIPYFNYKVKELKKRKKLELILNEGEENENNVPNFFKSLLHKIELQDQLEEFDRGSIDQTFYFYLDIMSDYGFVSLFSIAFPLTPLIIYINSLISMQVDRVKIMQFTKRPRPKGCQDIGNWMFILEFIAIISIFTNAGLLVFTSNHTYNLDYFLKFILFMGLVFLFISLKILIAYMGTDTGSRLVELQRRQKYVYQKMTKGKDLAYLSEYETMKKVRRTYLGIYFG